MGEGLKPLHAPCTYYIRPPGSESRYWFIFNWPANSQVQAGLGMSGIGKVLLGLPSPVSLPISNLQAVDRSRVTETKEFPRTLDNSAHTGNILGKLG